MVSSESSSAFSRAAPRYPCAACQSENLVRLCLRSPGSTRGKRVRSDSRAHRGRHPAADRARLAEQGRAGAALRARALVRPRDRAADWREPCRCAACPGSLQHPAERGWAQATWPTALRLRLPEPPAREKRRRAGRDPNAAAIPRWRAVAAEDCREPQRPRRSVLKGSGREIEARVSGSRASIVAVPFPARHPDMSVFGYEWAMGNSNARPMAPEAIALSS